MYILVEKEHCSLEMDEWYSGNLNFVKLPKKTSEQDLAVENLSILKISGS